MVQLLRMFRFNCRTSQKKCCQQGSWTNASKKQREKLLELIRRLAEDDKEGVMAHKVLGLLWNLAHSEDVPTDIMDQALTAHIKILDYSCSQVRHILNQFIVETYIGKLLTLHFFRKEEVIFKNRKINMWFVFRIVMPRKCSG